jgi:His-Xaa-Ser system protein HxsD
LSTSVEIVFDNRVFSLAAIKKASYRFIDKFSTDFLLTESEIACTLKFSPSYSEAAAKFIVDDFKKEVLDQDLRIIIASETENVRNLILAHAFSRTSLIRSDG